MADELLYRYSTGIPKFPMSSTEQALAVAPDRVPNSPPSRFTTGWKWLVPILSVVIFLYWKIVPDLVEDWWKDPNFSHGFLVPLFSGYIVWQDRDWLKELPLRPSWWGLVLMAGSLAILILGTLGSELFLSRSSLILLLGSMVIYFAGWTVFRALLFPILFLFLMVPIPTIIFNQVTIPLQFLASKLAAALLPLAGVPVLREGNVITLPSMPLEVAEACSGIRSLLSLTTLSIIYGYFLDKSNARRVLLVLASVPVAIGANALRVFGTGLAVQYWDPDKAQGFFHEFSGWVIFMVSLFLLFAIHGAIRVIWPDKRSSSETA